MRGEVRKQARTSVILMPVTPLTASIKARHKESLCYIARARTDGDDNAGSTVNHFQAEAEVGGEQEQQVGITLRASLCLSGRAHLWGMEHGRKSRDVCISKNRD